MEVTLDTRLVSDFVSQWEGKNHLYVLINMFRGMLPKYAGDKCDLSGSMTDGGNISLVLEAINAGDHALCESALMHLAKKINNNHSFPMRPTFKIAANIIEIITREGLKTLQDKITKTPEKIKNVIGTKIGETLEETEDRLDEVEEIDDYDYEDEESIGWISSASYFLVISSIGMVTLLF